MTGADRKIDRSRHPRPRTPAVVSVSIRALRPLLLYLAERGHDSSKLLQAQGLDPRVLEDPEARVPHTAATSLWLEAGRLTQDPDLGLHVAEAIRPGNFGVLDYIVRTSENLGMGFRQLARYHRLVHDLAEVKLTVRGGEAVLGHHLPAPWRLPRAVAEYAVAAWLLSSRLATGTRWTPLQVRFPHAAPDDLTEYRRVFGCDFQFGHERPELVFSRDILDLPLVKADPTLQKILEAQVVAVLERLPKGEATTDTVRRYLALELGEGQPTLEQIAPRLHMSPRTLHRRLEEEGTTFRQVLAEVRRELAARHLRERRLAIGEIAFLLGFSEPSAFHRAFKRWTGYAPLTYRESTPATP